jgi:hypothetical protein
MEVGEVASRPVLGAMPYTQDGDLLIFVQFIND